MTDHRQQHAHTAAEGSRGPIDPSNDPATDPMTGMPDMDTQETDAMASHGQATPNAFFFAAIIGHP